MYGKGVQHNGEAHWIKKQYHQTPSMDWSPVREKDAADALRTTLNWKRPNRKFWLKHLTAATNKHIAALFNKMIDEDQIPEWLTAAVTFLIPKNENTENPKNYKPVTFCLQYTNL